VSRDFPHHITQQEKKNPLPPFRGGECESVHPEAKKAEPPPPAELQAAARRVIDHYLKKTGCPHTAAGALKPVIELLQAGKTEAELKAAADRYAAFLSRNGTRSQAVQGPRRFYGQAGALPQFVQAPAPPPAPKPAAAEPPHERMDPAVWAEMLRADRAEEQRRLQGAGQPPAVAPAPAPADGPRMSDADRAELEAATREARARHAGARQPAPAEAPAATNGQPDQPAGKEGAGQEGSPPEGASP
jgi:hypothetical protein